MGISTRVGAVAVLCSLAACGSMSTSPDAETPPPRFTVTVSTNGNGAGVVTSAPGSIDCGSACSEVYDEDTSVTLTATPESGSTFVGWTGGGCTGTDACTLDVSADVTVTASFALDRTLMVALDGNGGGAVVSSPAGIDCGADCDEVYPAGTEVTVTAVPTVGSAFAGWSGGSCGGTGTCTVTLDAAVMITATFVLERFALSVTAIGTGTGTITSAPDGIACGADCVEDYDHGTVVVLTAEAAFGSTFTGWSGGGCTGTDPCTTTITAAIGVDAEFTLEQHALTVSRDGTGSGTVTSAPSGIDCGGDCTETYDHGTVVVLTAVAGSQSTFAGWSGACTGIGPCTTTVTGATDVTATFTRDQYALTVTRDGGGTGAVTSAPIGIDCGADCTESYDEGTVVVLTATADGGSTFAGWSGPCSGVDTCTTTISAATTVNATFLPEVMATITIARSGVGATGAVVSSTPAGVTCGASCTGTFPAGTVVTLSLTPGGGVFTGWSGAGCSGTSTCTVTLTASTTVTASFRAVRVGLETAASSCLRDAGSAFLRLQSLLQARGHDATIVAGTEIDTTSEINVYDVIVLPGPGSGCINADFATYDPVVDEYVRTAGHGVVASGWFLYNNIATPGILGVLPSTQVNNYLSGTQTVTPVAGSPITTGVGTFSTGEWLPWGGGPRPGATALLTVGATTVAESWQVNNGRAVYVGPMFVESYVSYANENLLDGTQSASIEFFLRAIEWAATAR